jgi:hypothetical protein
MEKSNGYVCSQWLPALELGTVCAPAGAKELLAEKSLRTVAEAEVMQWVSIQAVAQRFARSNGRLFG